MVVCVSTVLLIPVLFEIITYSIYLLGFPFFPDFQLPGKWKNFRNFPEIPGNFRDPGNPRNIRDLGNSGEIFSGKFSELDYLATRAVTKTFVLNCIIFNPTLSIF